MLRSKIKNEKQEKGITLIALVITVIVLLILAGVTISALSGDNGILNRSTEAVLQTEIGNIAEKINLIALNQTIGTEVDSTEEDTISYLSSKGIINDENVIDTAKLLGNKTTFGKGTENDVFKIEGSKLVYINKDGEKTTYRDLNIETNDFITEWNVEANDIIVLPISIGYNEDNNFIVDWGDGSATENIDDTEEILTQRPQHQYAQAGNYRITISGKCNFFTFSSIAEEYPEQLVKLTKLIAWGEIKAKAYEFADAVNLEGNIPSPSKNTFSNCKPSGFKYLFLNCSKITSIPADLFANIPDNVTSFEATFEGCTSLNSIPQGLFDKAQNVTSFKSTFNGCTSLNSIPQGLFDKAQNVTSFYKTFYRCTNIQTIPDNIFKNNQKVTDFQLTFYDLQKITSVPKLWERTTEGVNGTSCFGSCDLLNTTNIPSPWADSEA